MIMVVALMLALNVTSLTAREVRLPEGTRVPLKLMQFLFSETNRPGDSVLLQVARDVAVMGTVVIRRGTPVTGMVVDAKPYRSHWWLRWGRVRPGRLVFDVTETRSTNGDPIRLRLSANQRRRFAPAPLIRWEHEGEIFEAVVDGTYVMQMP